MGYGLEAQCLATPLVARCCLLLQATQCGGPRQSHLPYKNEASPYKPGGIQCTVHPSHAEDS
jgi:hypothetical protein